LELTSSAQVQNDQKKAWQLFLAQEEKTIGPMASRNKLLELDLSQAKFDLSDVCENQRPLQAKQALLPGKLFNF